MYLALVPKTSPTYVTFSDALTFPLKAKIGSLQNKLNSNTKQKHADGKSKQKRPPSHQTKTELENKTGSCLIKI